MARGRHCRQRCAIKGAAGLAGHRQMPERLGRGSGRRRRGHAGSASPPGPDLLGHAHAEGGPHTGLHHATGCTARLGHAFGGVELHVFAEITRHPDRGALVEHLFNFFRQRDVFNVEFRQAQAVFGNFWRDRSGDKLAEIAGTRRHVKHRNTTLENSCTMTLRI